MEQNLAECKKLEKIVNQELEKITQRKFQYWRSNSQDVSDVDDELELFSTGSNFLDTCHSFLVGSGVGLASYLGYVYFEEGHFHNFFEIAVPAILFSYGSIGWIATRTTPTWKSFFEGLVAGFALASIGRAVYNFVYNPIKTFFYQIISLFSKKNYEFKWLDWEMLKWQLLFGLGTAVFYNILYLYKKIKE